MDVREEYSVVSKYAFNRKTQTHRIDLDNYTHETLNEDSIRATLVGVESTIINLIATAVNEHSAILAALNLEGIFIDHEYKTFNLDAKKEVRTGTVQQYIDQTKAKIISKYRNYHSIYPGRKRLLTLKLHIHKCSRYVNKIDLKKFQNHIIDCESNDEMSFKWAVLTALNLNVDLNELERITDINLDNIDFPVQLDDLPHIEENNNFSVNVYMIKYSYISNGFEIDGPVYHTQGYKQRHVNLLLVHDDRKYRYCCIRDLKSLMVERETTESFCEGCLNSVNNTYFNQHREDECLKAKTLLSQKGFIEFEDDKLIGKTTPIVVYADFHVMLEPIGHEQQTKNGQTWTKNIYKHVPYSFCYYIKYFESDIPSCMSEELEPLYIGFDCVSKFVENLIEDLKKYVLVFKEKHQDDHIEFIPVIVHDLKNYVGHLMLQGSTYDFLMYEKETYLGIFKKIRIGNQEVTIRFLDSKKFLDEPLMKSLKNLEPKEHEETNKFFKNSQRLALIKDKRGFPHFYVSSLDTLKETSLPVKDNFKDITTNSKITDDQYAHARNIWRKFNHRNIGDYLDLYLKSKVLLLGDVFEKFRRVCQEHYQLDPAYYYSLAEISWSAMLKQTRVRLELLTDVEMLLFIKKGIRGGYVHCNPQYSKASNRYINEQAHQNSEDESYLMYFDANNAYGYAMCKPLPYGDFEWVKDENERNTCIKSLENDVTASEDSETGYIFEVNLDYPDLRKNHSDYPFCPEIKIARETGDKTLVAELRPKIKYVIHFSYLALCLKHGLVIEKVHRILKFKQKRWMKPFIESNTEKRINSMNESEKLLFKMINITVYGKTIMNPNKYTNSVLLHDWDTYIKNAFDYITRPDYQSHVICSENMLEVKQRNTHLTYKYPIYVGFSILDLAKTRMYEFYYDFMKETFGDNLSLLYTDNDSFIFQINGVNCYQIIKDHGSDFFDTSGYGANNPFDMPLRNDLRVGYFKDVMDGVVVQEYVGLRPKMYILQPVKANLCSENIKKAALNVPPHVREKFGVEHYKECFIYNEPVYETFRVIKEVDHDVYTQEVRKKCLSTPRTAENLIIRM